MTDSIPEKPLQHVDALADWQHCIPLIPNMAVIHYLRRASSMLDLPVRTTATAICYYHRFNKFMAQQKHQAVSRNAHPVDDALPLHTNHELLATTCLHLACKSTEVPRKVRDLVNVGYRYYHPNDGILQVDETYFKMRSSLVTSELLLVRALDYDLEVDLPFAFCLNVLRNMASVPLYKELRRYGAMTGRGWQKDLWRQMEQDIHPDLSAIARLAWMFLWDSLISPKIVLNHSTPGVALGCLYLALRTSNAPFPFTMSEWVDMWGASENISVQAVRDVVTDLLELYEKSSITADDAHE